MQIQEKTGFSLRQIGYPWSPGCPATPTKKPGCLPTLTQAQIDDLVLYVCMSARNRRLSFQHLGEELGLGVERKAIRAALMKEGFHGRLAMKKHPLSERNQQIQLRWAQEHVNCSQEQWNSIVWTDETWITGGRHTRTWVTRRAGEKWDPTCIVEKHQRKRGWIFWGHFPGNMQGPGIFWEKARGSINAESYCAHTVPIIHGYMELCRRDGIYLKLMQDGVPGHAGGDTVIDLQERGIEVIFWPAFSPDLNPIKRVWYIVKNYLQENFPEQMSYNRSRVTVKEAWETIVQDEF